jgi:general secretion pathway protein G
MYLTNLKKSPKGFTLIEVLVVVALIGILSAILVANYNDARKNSRDKIRKSDLKSIQLAVELYKSQNSTYPANISSLSPTYLASVPVDPSGSSYSYTTNGASYKVFTSNVESAYITSFSDEFAKCPRQGSNCSSVSAIQNVYAVYSAGAEDW